MLVVLNRVLTSRWRCWAETQLGFPLHLPIGTQRLRHNQTEVFD